MNFSNTKEKYISLLDEYEMKSLEELENLVGNDDVIKEYLQEQHKIIIHAKKLGLEKHVIMFERSYKQRIISILWSRKTKFTKEFFSIMFSELKRDYINKYGVEKYIIEEESIKMEIIDIIKKKKEMLLRWDDTIID